MRNLKKFEDGRRPDMRGTIWNETDDKEHVINYYEHFMNNFNREMTLSNRVNIDDCNQMNRIREINRCFYSNSVEEIKENLRMEGSEWAMETLKKIEKNSPTSCELSLRLIREAKLSSMGECMRREMVVARNRVQDPEFQHGVESVLLHSGETKWAPLDPTAIDDYFKGDLGQFLLHFHAGAPMPTRQYWKRYPDHLRLWLCERSTWVNELRYDYDQNVKVALRNEGIDVRDSSLSFESARKNLWAKEQYERFQDYKNDLNGRFFNDTTFSDQYYEQVAERIADLNGDSSEYYDVINDAINAHFEDKLRERMDLMVEKNTEAHSILKRRMFIRMKKRLFESRVLSFTYKDFEKQLERVENMPHKAFRIPKDYSVSYLDEAHPELEGTLAAEIGKHIKLTRAPGTNSDLVFVDKEGLSELQAELASNPDKFLNVTQKYKKPVRYGYHLRFEQEDLDAEIEKYIAEADDDEDVQRLREAYKLEEQLTDLLRDEINNLLEKADKTNIETAKYESLIKLRCQIAETEVPETEKVSLNANDLINSSDFKQILDQTSNELIKELQTEQKQLVESLFEKEMAKKENLIPDALSNPIDRAVTNKMKQSVKTDVEIAVKREFCHKTAKNLQAEAEKLLDALNFDQYASNVFATLEAAKLYPELTEQISYRLKNNSDVPNDSYNSLEKAAGSIDGFRDFVRANVGDFKALSPLEKLAALTEVVEKYDFDISKGSSNARTKIEANVQ